jgi:hypothetical protein
MAKLESEAAPNAERTPNHYCAEPLQNTAPQEMAAFYIGHTEYMGEIQTDRDLANVTTLHHTLESARFKLRL